VERVSVSTTSCVKACKIPVTTVTTHYLVYDEIISVIVVINDLIKSTVNVDFYISTSKLCNFQTEVSCTSSGLCQTPLHIYLIIFVCARCHQDIAPRLHRPLSYVSFTCVVLTWRQPHQPRFDRTAGMAGMWNRGRALVIFSQAGSLSEHFGNPMWILSMISVICSLLHILANLWHNRNDTRHCSGTNYSKKKNKKY
jgi:hypothetical protein